MLLFLKSLYSPAHSTQLSKSEFGIAGYVGKQQEFLDFVLEQYVKAGVGELDRAKLPQLLELKYHAIRDAVAELGSVGSISEVFIGFQEYLYARDKAAWEILANVRNRLRSEWTILI